MQVFFAGEGKAGENKNLSVFAYVEVFLVGAGGLREPRSKRSPGRGSQRLHRALGGTRILLAAAPTAPPCFCRWQRSSLLLFESTRSMSLALLQNKNLSVFAYVEVFWWARVDSNNQYIIFIGLPGCFSCVLAAL